MGVLLNILHHSIVVIQFFKNMEHKDKRLNRFNRLPINDLLEQKMQIVGEQLAFVET